MTTGSLSSGPPDGILHRGLTLKLLMSFVTTKFNTAMWSSSPSSSFRRGNTFEDGSVLSPAEQAPHRGQSLSK